MRLYNLYNGNIVYMVIVSKDKNLQKTVAFNIDIFHVLYNVLLNLTNQTGFSIISFACGFLLGKRLYS